MFESAGWVIPFLVIAWFAIAWRVTVVPDRHSVIERTALGVGLSLQRLRAVPVFLVIAATGVLLSAPSLQTAILAGYPGDSLFTLEPAEIAGVVLISLTLITLFFWLLSLVLVPLARAVAAKPLMRAGTATASLAGSLLLFGVSHTVSPQIYYTFYRWIIPGLPDQWVIRTWLDLERLAGAASLAPDGSLSSHLTGVTIWCVALFVAWIFMMRWQDDAWQASPLIAGIFSSGMLLMIRLVAP